MKKIFTLMMLFTMGIVAAQAECQDGPYGLKINGSKVVDAPKFGDPDAQGRVQYKATCVELNAGDELQLVNTSCDATWMIDLDPYGEYQNFEGGKAANKLTCKVAGSYDFYIKLKENDDLIYVEYGKDCGGSTPGGDPTPGGGSVEGNPRYYYKMYTASDEQWHEPSEYTLFDHGVADMLDYTGDAYVFIIYQVDGKAGEQYRTESFVDSSHRQARLVLNGPSDWQLPAGVTNLYLYDNEDGSLTVSADPISGKKPADPQPVQAIDNTMVTEKAHKVMIDGQLIIVRGDKMFDATGRQL